MIQPSTRGRKTLGEPRILLMHGAWQAISLSTWGAWLFFPFFLFLFLRHVLRYPLKAANCPPNNIDSKAGWLFETYRGRYDDHEGPAS